MYTIIITSIQETAIDYIIADWDDIQIYEENDLYEINRNGFNTALRQFVDRYVDEKAACKYLCLLERIKGSSLQKKGLDKVKHFLRKRFKNDYLNINEWQL